MNEIIKNIEAAQLKENVPSFNVGDTVKVYSGFLRWSLIEKTSPSSSSKRSLILIIPTTLSLLS